MNTAYEEVVKSNKCLAMLHYVSGVEASEKDDAFVKVLLKTLETGVRPEDEKFDALVKALLSIYVHGMAAKAVMPAEPLEDYLWVHDKESGIRLCDDFCKNAAKENIGEYIDRVIGRVSWMKSRTEEDGSWKVWGNEAFRKSFDKINLASGNMLFEVKTILWLYEDILRHKDKAECPKYDCHSLKSILLDDGVDFYALLCKRRCSAIQVEHIMPRKVREDDKSYVVEGDPDDKNLSWWDYLDCLGNYSLITPCVNYEAVNKSFGEKCSIYKENDYCGLLQLKEVCDAGTAAGGIWEGPDINARHHKIIDTILEWDEGLCPVSWGVRNTRG